MDGGWVINPNLIPPWTNWSGINLLPPPAPPTLLGPQDWRPIAIVDCWGVALADPEGDLVGTDGGLGRGGPLANLLNTTRSNTRNL